MIYEEQHINTEDPIDSYPNLREFILADDWTSLADLIQSRGLAKNSLPDLIEAYKHEAQMYIPETPEETAWLLETLRQAFELYANYDTEARLRVDPLPMSSQHLANLLDRSIGLDQLNHLHRVQALYAYDQLYKATMNAGELEHTNDWDWELLVKYKGEHGREIELNGFGDENQAETYYSFYLPYQYDEPVAGTEPYPDHMEDFARWQEIIVNGEDEENNQLELHIPIDSLISIQYREV